MSKEILIVSNSCVGHHIIHNIYANKEYETPFIGTLIPNDDEYLKLCNNILYYMKVEPIINCIPKEHTKFQDQSKNTYCKHPAICIPYPIIHLEDIEIHCIHENDIQIALDKFNRRRQRFLKTVELDNYLILNVWAYGELFNDHINCSNLINSFLYNYSIEYNIKNIFLGPSFFKANNSYYIPYDIYNNVSLMRNESYVYIFNNQIESSNALYNYISSNFL
jgi:uncharacterized protein (DUF1919 family)